MLWQGIAPLSNHNQIGKTARLAKASIRGFEASLIVPECTDTRRLFHTKGVRINGINDFSIEEILPLLSTTLGV